MTEGGLPVPPSPTTFSDEAAEQVVLGSAMLDPSAMDELMELLKPEDFYNPTHAVLYSTFVKRLMAGLPIDPISVTPDLMGDRYFVSAGGPAYLHYLVSIVPVPAMSMSYARTVVDRAVRRRLHMANVRIGQLIAMPDLTPDEIIDRSSQLLNGAASDDQIVMSSVLDVADDVIAELENPPDNSRDMALGVADLDAALGPVRPGHFVLVAARPGAGKSLALLQAARFNAFHAGKVVLSFSLEMSSKEWVMRILCAESGVNSKRLIEQDLTEDDWARLSRARGRLVTATYGIVDKSQVTVSEIMSHARRFKRRHDGVLDMITVDYIQLISANPKVNRQEQISEITRALKIGARELDCAIYAASQLNRGPEARTDKRPLLSDLRESGSLEQDPDSVILLYRPDYYDPGDRPNEIDFIIAKNRHGITTTVTARTELYASRFRSFTVGAQDR